MGEGVLLRVRILGTVCSMQPPANWSAKPGHNLYGDKHDTKLDRVIFLLIVYTDYITHVQQEHSITNNAQSS